jgi:hypothetical protein
LIILVAGVNHSFDTPAWFSPLSSHEQHITSIDISLFFFINFFVYYAKFSMFPLIAWITLLTQTTMVEDTMLHIGQVTVRERTYEDLERLPTQGVDSKYPTWFQPDLFLVHQNIEHWLNILPYPEDRNLNRYLVAPIQ